MIFCEIFSELRLLYNIFAAFLHFTVQLSAFSISYIDSMLRQGVAHVRHNLPHLATHLPRTGTLRLSDLILFRFFPLLAQQLQRPFFQPGNIPPRLL